MEYHNYEELCKAERRLAYKTNQLYAIRVQDMIMDWLKSRIAARVTKEGSKAKEISEKMETKKKQIEKE